jgi:hypothetical protein
MMLGPAIFRVPGGIVLALVFGVLLLNSVVSCGACEDDYDGALNCGSLKRTQLDAGWYVKEFPYSGVSAELPVGVDEHYVFDSDGAFIGLHIAAPPRWVLDDARPLLQITLDRLSREEFEERKAQIRRSGMYKDSDEKDRARLEWRVAWHDSIERDDSGGYTYYKYEIECPDESVVRMHVELVNLRRGGIAVHEEEDEAAIRRILNSVECIEQVPLPERSSG